MNLTYKQARALTGKHAQTLTLETHENPKDGSADFSLRWHNGKEVHQIFIGDEWHNDIDTIIAFVQALGWEMWVVPYDPTTAAPTMEWYWCACDKDRNPMTHGDSSAYLLTPRDAYLAGLNEIVTRELETL